VFERVSSTPSIGPILSLLFGLGFLAVFIVGAGVLFIVAWSFLRRSPAGSKLDAVAAKLDTATSIDVSDGLDEREMALVRKLFARQKETEEEAAVKERLAAALKAKTS
jgi:hypothetical protein